MPLASSSPRVDIAEIRKSKREVIRVTLESRDGRDILNVREWFESGDGVLRPGKRGLCCRASLLPDIARAIAQVEAEARAKGLLT